MTNPCAGAPAPAHLIYRNFVSSRADRIEQAKEDWREQRFASVPAETDFIPLPPDPFPARVR
ncbi:pirin-like C-terminal cupin domain-containing protein [Sphingomonas oleivorans]|uniref:pirin-like C-terminal cupin domain-containing protein n=1 Tax=Sphingomonas oleivorans TaxID=1735121 RepID=UPI002435F051|nr:pirin-like C-terminal cupin domain-containing protein [Sphingomonas oleivorans]